MTRRTALLLVCGVAGTLLLAQLHPNPPGRITSAVSKAKSEQRKTVRLIPPEVLYAEVTSLDDVLRAYTVVRARLVSRTSMVGPDGNQIWTLCRFQVLDLLHGQLPSTASTSTPPDRLGPLTKEQFLVRNLGGKVTIDDVEVDGTDYRYPEFRVDRQYLLFISFKTAGFGPNSRVGEIEIGPQGVLEVDSDGKFIPPRSRSILYDALNSKVGNVESLKAFLYR